MLLEKQQWWHDQEICQNSQPKQGQKEIDKTNIPQLDQAIIPLSRLNGRDKIKGNTFFKLCSTCFTQYFLY